jgi:hypothetical protein
MLKTIFLNEHEEPKCLDYIESNKIIHISSKDILLSEFQKIMDEIEKNTEKEVVYHSGLAFSINKHYKFENCENYEIKIKKSIDTYTKVINFKNNNQIKMRYLLIVNKDIDGIFIPKNTIIYPTIKCNKRHINY